MILKVEIFRGRIGQPAVRVCLARLAKPRGAWRVALRLVAGAPLRREEASEARANRNLQVYRHVSIRVHGAHSLSPVSPAHLAEPGGGGWAPF